MQFRFTLPTFVRGVLLASAVLLGPLTLMDCTSASGMVGSAGVLANRFSATPASRIAISATHEEIASAADGTYIDRILADRDSVLDRWPVRVERPVRVYIESGVDHSVPAAFPAIVRAAFDEWTSTGIPVRFQFVSRPRDAEVRVRWTDYLPGKTGSTTWRTDDAGWLKSGDITLATHVSDGHPLNPRGVRIIALHEIGHALGLSHSTDGHDIMAPVIRVNQLSPADLATIRLLYELPAGRVR